MKKQHKKSYKKNLTCFQGEHGSSWIMVGSSEWQPEVSSFYLWFEVVNWPESATLSTSLKTYIHVCNVT